ncbi:hypothetical protein GOP47_0012659 [Adiantum capillus-veneris]|uniref:DDT domain-containing protein n=1 Tax=Adiantum capillus-veneris TaxID=13818 RepID=A0A9D4UR38_ADICA|nr:hypothetical protein GOP47_0012659 [Adiantum capillus-veneris]
MPTKKAEAARAVVSPSKMKRTAELEEDVHGAQAGATTKRRKGLGLRVIGGRIYDSENGRTCHQCRQKTIDFMASCKASFRSRPCTQHYCAKCLLNRYGEKVTEVSQLPSWSCPKCRRECNCSICLKKQGCVPTGILAHTAKATGFTSVAELLKKRSAVRVDHNEAAPSPGMAKAKKRKLVVTADGEVEGPVANALLRTPPTKQKKAPVTISSDVASPAKKRKNISNAQGTIQEFLVPKTENGTTVSGVSELELSKVKREDGHVLVKKSKKKNTENKGRADNEESKPLIIKNSKAAKKNLSLEVKVKVEGGAETCKTQSRPLGKKDVKQKWALCDASDKPKLGNLTSPKVEAEEPKKKGQAGKTKFSSVENEVVLPEGAPITMVAGMDFPTEAIGSAVQFVEFCFAFQSVLGLRRGDAEAVLRELTKGRLARKGSNSLLVQLHAKLLNIIESSFSASNGEVTHSSSGKRSWLNVLNKHLNERSCILKSLSKDSDKSLPTSFMHGGPVASTVVLEEDLRTMKIAVEEGVESYENLGLYHKLQLLVILCDDSLETQIMRDHIESANREYTESQKGTREEVLAARKEVRDAKQKIKDAEVAKLIALGNLNGPLTHEDQEALLNKVLAETERAVAAASLEKEAISRMKKGRSDAVRTDAIAWSLDHRAFYKLKGVENTDRVVVQECKAGQPTLDSWRVYSDADEAILTKYLLQRAKISRKKMLAEAGLEDFHVEGGDAEKENRIPIAVKAYSSLPKIM